MPEVINIEKIKANNLVEMSPIDFVCYVDEAKAPIIFKDIDSYYLMKEGFCFYSYHYNSYNSYEQFSQYAEKILKAGFKNPELYESSKSFGKFENEQDYVRFSNGGFFPQYDEYMDAKKRGFTELKNYKEANLLGIQTKAEFLTFKNSNFYQEKYSSRLFQYDIFTQKHKMLNDEAYRQFKESNS